MCTPFASLSCSCRMLYRLLKHGLVSFLTLLLFLGIIIAQYEKGISTLEQGQTIEREIAGGQTHVYKVLLVKGQFLRVTVEQQSIDVSVTLRRPNGEKILVIDLRGIAVSESLSFIADSAGEYKIEVAPGDKNTKAGRYQISIVIKGEADETDKNRMAAERLLVEAAEKLNGKLTKENALAALENRRQALQLWRKIADKEWEAQTQAALLAKEIESLTTELQQVETQIRQTSPRYAALTQPQPLSLKEIQAQVLDAETLLMEYSLGEQRSYLWVVTQTSIASYELPARAEIEAVARQVYELLNARNPQVANETEAQRRARITRADAQYPQAAARLGQMTLAPVAKQLGNKRLLIVSDGGLQYIPFAALPDPTIAAVTPPPLIVNHEIVSLPSASTVAVLRHEAQGRQPANKTIAVLADPVFDSDDQRVVQKRQQAMGRARRPARTDKKRDLPLGLERAAQESGVRDTKLLIPRLPGTRQEAEQILSLVPAAERKQAFDFAANRATATSADLSQYRYVHFATHGLLDSLHPELSGIVLSLVDKNGNAQDGFLRAHEIYNLKLPAELVVLSACQTGLGKEIKGEGLVGLTRGFMYAGAPRVVVSLWSVSDAGTAELMTRLYKGMLVNKLRPAKALQVAQVSMLKEKGFSAPFYWAAFTLQGEWR